MRRYEGRQPRPRRPRYEDDYYYQDYRRPRRKGFSCFHIILGLVCVLLVLALLYFLYVALTPYLAILGKILFGVLILAALFGICWLGLFLYGVLQEQLQKRDNRDLVRLQKDEKVVVRQRKTKDLRYLAQEEPPAPAYQPQAQMILPRVYETPTDPMLEAVKPVEPDQPKETIIHYANVHSSIRPGQILLGVNPDTGQLEIGEWDDLRTVLVLGESATGKTNTMSEKVAQVVENNMLIVPCDPHAQKKDSLFRRIQPLRGSLFPGANFAVQYQDILYNAQLVREELDYRKSGGQYSKGVLLVIDEWNEIYDEEISREITYIAQKIGREGRGFHIYLMIGAQEITGQMELKKSLVARIIHRCDKTEAEKVIPSQFAKYAPELPNGMTFVKANGKTRLLQQSLITRVDIQTIANDSLDMPFNVDPAASSPKRTRQFTHDLNGEQQEFPRNGQAFQNSVSAFPPSFSAQKHRFDPQQQYIETEAFRLPYHETPQLPPARPQQHSRQDGYALLRAEAIRLARAGTPRRQIAAKLGLQGEKYKILVKILSEAGL